MPLDRRLPRRPPNSQFRSPRTYLAGGFWAPDGLAPRAELLGDWAVGVGRELLIEGLTLDALGLLARELDALSRLAADDAEARTRLQALAMKPGYQQPRLLADLLAAGAAATRTRADARAFAQHVRRAHTLASFERALGIATALERSRAPVAEGVRKSRGGRLPPKTR